jgi:hypothetical protein
MWIFINIRAHFQLFNAVFFPYASARDLVEAGAVKLDWLCVSRRLD